MTRLMLAALLALPLPAAAQELSGVWLIDEPRGSFSTDAPPAMTPAGAARFAMNKPTIGPNAVLDANDPTLDCVPPGVPYILAVPTPFEFVHAPGQIIQLFEYSHFVRRIHMDGRDHPADLYDTGSHEWMGHSIGRWDGDTLVVDTIGFNDATWLDRLGRPHSDRLRVIERIRRVDADTLRYEVTVDDPQTYTAPWVGTMTFRQRRGWALLEHTCVSEESAKYREYRERAWRPDAR